MKQLRKVGAVVVLTLVLVLTVPAGQIETPPCAAPVPGQIETPPCASASGDMTTPGVDSTSPGDLASPTVNGEISLTDFAADLLLKFLPLY